MGWYQRRVLFFFFFFFFFLKFFFFFFFYKFYFIFSYNHNHISIRLYYNCSTLFWMESPLSSFFLANSTSCFRSSISLCSSSFATASDRLSSDAEMSSSK